MAIPIYYEGEDFYVPYFEVKLEGRPLGEDIVRDIMQVTYTDSTEEIDSFELVINNWDAESGPVLRERLASEFDRDVRVAHVLPDARVLARAEGVEDVETAHGQSRAAAFGEVRFECGDAAAEHESDVP